jgi:aerobic C4-dicarboxylate transport protein
MKIGDCGCLMAKLENPGAHKSVVGLVVPAGYSFNLDGTSIYLTMAAIFIAQATNTQLDWTHRLTLLAVEEAEEPEEMVA